MSYHGKIDPRKTGATDEEFEIMNLLNSVRSKFLKLEQTHPDDINKFTDAIHDIQSVFGLRILRRDYPDFWITKKDKNLKENE